MRMLQADQTPESRYQDAPLWVCVRFVATWLLGGTILGVLFGLWTGISVGLLMEVSERGGAWGMHRSPLC